MTDYTYLQCLPALHAECLKLHGLHLRHANQPEGQSQKHTPTSRRLTDNLGLSPPMLCSSKGLDL